MGLESATYINGLVESNPPSNDPKSQGDDHIRLLKAVQKNTFPNADRPFYFPRGAAKTANYTILAADQNKIITGDATGGAFDFTLPTLGASNDGWSVRLVKVDNSANAIGVVGTMNGGADFDLLTQYQSLLVIWTGSTWLRFHSPAITSAGVLVLPAETTATSLEVLARLILPSWDTAGRPGTPEDGLLGFNTDLLQIEFYDSGDWRQPSLARPIAGGFKNLVVTNNAANPNTRIDIDADALTVETSGGTAYRLTGVNVTINPAGTGADGIDVGGLAINSWYYSFVIYNPATNTKAGLLSLSATAPTLPSGYTAFMRTGSHRTDAAAEFYGTKQIDKRVQYIVGLGKTSIARLLKFESGASGSITTPTWSNFVISDFVPPTATMVHGHAATGTNGSLILAPNNSYGSISSTNNRPPVAIQPASAGGHASSYFSFMIETTTFYYATATNGASIFCDGWDESI